MRRIVSVVAMCALALSGAENPFLGTWELNTAKSKLDASSPTIQSQTVNYALDGSLLKAALTTDGKPSAHPTVYDGQEHEYGGTSALRPTHIIPTRKGNMLETVFKRNGLKVGTRKNTLSADGLTMTVVTDGTKLDGSKYLSVLVFDKKQ
jgi:hypothetical protein